ncbi:MAG: Hsp20/alpha crystallin family protein [bacterium]|nr:Hsp20/alpha crystallin family protein [bacterium]
MDRKYHPLTEFRGVEDIVDRTLWRFFSDFFPGRWRRPWAEEIAPACDLIDRGDHLLLRAEVPGLKKEDLEISVDESSISLKGEIKKSTEEKGETYYRSERSYGSFSRSITFPTEIDSSKTDATLKDGILEVKLPKKKEKIAKKVEIKIK